MPKLTPRFILLVVILFVLIALALLIPNRDSKVDTSNEVSLVETTTTEPSTTTTLKETTTTTSTTTTIPPTTTTIPPTTTTAKTYSQNDSGVNWHAIAMCESSLGTGSPQWHINTGNGYYGGLQFSHSTWIAYGGGRFAENAHLTSAENQIAIASTMSLSHWPTCGRYG